MGDGDQASLQKNEDDKFTFRCPFPNCGRKFTSEVDLKNHMTRRHKKNEEEKGADKQNSLKSSLKTKNVFETQKKVSAKGVKLMDDEN